MNESGIITFFDSPERSPLDDIIKDYLLFQVNPLINQILEGYPEFVVVLNKNRQIVAFNNKVYTAFNASSPEQILGKRVGEVMNCIHSHLMPGGCGTSQFCRECGAAKAIKFTNEKSLSAEEECKITSSVGSKEVSFEFNVYSQPIAFKGTNYTLFAVKDISGVKRKEALERIFFHDILNTTGAISGIANLLGDAENKEEREELLNAIMISSQQLMYEIVSQRDLRYAEDGNLQLNIREISLNEIIEIAFKLYERSDHAKYKVFTLQLPEDDIKVKSDKTLLIRCIGNLIKNALEASGPNEPVKVYSYYNDEFAYINIFNNQVIPENVRLQLFQRSFSTKQSKGRGLGLYSVKLIIEQYLMGKVSFVTNDVFGTVFTIQLPLEFHQQEKAI